MGELLTQPQFELTPPETKQLTPMEMANAVLSRCDNPKDAVDVVRELFKLNNEMERIKAEADFNDALTRCQSEIGTIAPDAQGQKKKYATYQALDRVVRPVYLRNNLNVSFGSGTCDVPNHIMVTCDVSLRSYTRHYEIPMDASGLGPKGDGALSKPHAILAAAEYGRRILLKMIFNVVTGEEDQVTNGEMVVALEDLQKCRTMDALTQVWRSLYSKYNETNPEAIGLLLKAKNECQKKIQNGRQ